MRKSRGTVLAGLGALLLVLAARSAGAQATSREYDPWEQSGARFLNREYYPWWDEGYENYSILSYRDYGAIAAQRENPTYDPFGTYLLDGVELLRVEEYRTLAPQRSSRVFRDPRLRTAFRNLVVMHDHLQGWSNRVMIGDALQARFTPLTLDQPRLQGLRWDASSHKNRFSAIASRVSSPIDEGSNDAEFSTYLLGGHWESQLGDVLTLGASYVNLHIRDSMQRQGSFGGEVPSALGSTRDFFVIFSDDSPADRTGAQVYAVEVIINGVTAQIEPDIRRVDDIVQADHVAHLRRHGAWAPQSLQADRLLAVDQGRYFSAASVGPQLPWTVDGTDLLVFRYEIPDDVEDLRFRAQVAGDYSIDVGASFPFEGADRTWSDWHNVARAPGNVADGSNLRWVDFDYGFPTALVQYGSNASLRLLGATLDAEYVDNIASRQFPRVPGHRTESHRAFFLKLLRPAAWGEVGGEVFHMPARYQTELSMWSEHAGEVIDYELVRDNDDDDVWPDAWEHWDPLDPLYLSLKSQTGLDPESRPTQAAQDNLSGNLGNGLGFGVYPGLDLDDDTVLDINITQNGTPDYAEPFLMYAVEPDEFVYGDDFNNNGTVDDRENDNRPDYPYPLDSGGYHLFGEVRPRPDLRLRLGRYRVGQHAGDGHNDTDYLEARYAGTPADTRLQLDYRIRRVRDDIPDPVYRVVIDPLSTTNSSVRIQHDRLLMRDSWVHTAFAEVRREHRGLQASAATKLDVNALRASADAGRQRLTDWYLVGKADYTYERGRLRLTPMAKFLHHRRQAPGELLTDVLTYEAFPILRLDYDLGPHTVVRAGVQGLPGWPHMFRDHESEAGAFDARHFIFVVQNRTNYTGYELSINSGFRASRTRFIHVPSRRLHRLKEFFVQARVL